MMIYYKLNALKSAKIVNLMAKKKPGVPPAVILIIMAIIVFGIMFAFMYAENLNPEWLRPTG